MKKLFFLAVMCLMTAAAFSAEPRKFYFLYLDGHEDEPMSSWFQVDVDKKICVWDGDSDGTTHIKNYKKVGNVETFDIYGTDGPFIENMEITTTDEKITVIRTYDNGKKFGPIVIGEEAARNAYFKKSGKDDGGGSGSIKDRVVGGAKNVFGKTKEVFKKKKNEIKVISYNVRLSGGDGENHWDKRKQASIAMINEEKPTVFGVQEAKADQMAYLVENLPDYGYIGVGREDGKSGGEHMTIFYLKDQVELLDGGTFWLSETPEVPSIGWDAACKRSCTWTKLKMKDTGKEFAYINTHLDHVGKVAQREGLALICKRFAEIVPKNMPAFLTADFNALTTDSIFEPLNAEMKDARVEAPETDKRATYNGWKTDNENDANLVIDHIFFRGAEAHTFKVLRDKNYGAPFISDHYPVVMTATF